MSEMKSNTLGFMKSNQTYIRIAVEIIVVLILCYYFTSKNSSILKHIENVSQRLEELEDGTNEQISKLTEINNQLIHEINSLKQQLQSHNQIQTDSRKRKMESSDLANSFSIQQPYPLRQTPQQPMQQIQPHQQPYPPRQPPHQPLQQIQPQTVKLPDMSKISIDEKDSEDTEQVILKEEEENAQTVSEYNDKVDKEDLDEALKNEIAELDE